MANYPNFNLSGQEPSTTFQYLVQHNSASLSMSFVDGLGNTVDSASITASNAINAINAVTASTANNVTSATQILIRSQDSIVATAPNNIVLDATGALFMSADTSNITMTPHSAVEIQGSLIVDVALSSPSMSLTTATTPGVLVNSNTGFITSQVGLTTTQSWVDVGTLTTQSMYLSRGLVVSWSFHP